MRRINFGIILAAFQFYVFFQYSLAVLSVEDYCEKFPENLRPIICILRENQLVPRSSSTTQDPWKNVTWPGSSESESEEEDDEESNCDCDLTCFPPPESTNTSEENSKLNCKPCGSHCDVSTEINPKCSCAAVGLGLSEKTRRRQQTCKCVVTCAGDTRDNKDPYCIFKVTGLQSFDDPRPVRCECCKSTLAENNDYPDFVCVCQRI